MQYICHLCCNCYTVGFPSLEYVNELCIVFWWRFCYLCLYLSMGALISNYWNWNLDGLILHSSLQNDSNTFCRQKIYHLRYVICQYVLNYYSIQYAPKSFGIWLTKQIFNSTLHHYVGCMQTGIFFWIQENTILHMNVMEYLFYFREILTSRIKSKNS